MFQYLNYRSFRRRRTTARNWKRIWKNNEGKLPQSNKGKRLPESPGSSESQRIWTQGGTQPRHINIKLPKIKDERILKAVRGKERVTYKEVPIRPSTDFSKEMLQAIRGWKEVFKFMKGKDLHPRLLYPAKLSSFRLEGQLKCFPD